MIKYFKALWSTNTEETGGGTRWERTCVFLVGCAIIAMGFVAWAQAIHRVKPFETAVAERARVQGYVTKWQQLLQMQDWTIVMRVLPEDEIGMGLAGWSRTDSKNKIETVLVCRALDYPQLRTDSELTNEQENTVAHELTHALIRYAIKDGLGPDFARNDEEVVSKIADALVPVVKK